MIKNILFDLGGVMIDFNPQRSLENHFAPEHRDAVDRSVFKSILWREMDRGTYKVEDAVAMMCESLPAELHSEVYSMVIEREKEMPPIEGMYSVVKALKESGYGIYLLSNCPAWFESFVPSVPALAFFDGWLVSSECGHIKPEKEIYTEMFRKFNLKAEECFFVDDSDANIRAGEELGMAGHCFADRDFDKLISHMKNEGIKL